MGEKIQSGAGVLSSLSVEDERGRTFQVLGLSEDSRTLRLLCLTEPVPAPKPLSSRVWRWMWDAGTLAVVYGLLVLMAAWLWPQDSVARLGTYQLVGGLFFLVLSFVVRWVLERVERAWA